MVIKTSKIGISYIKDISNQIVLVFRIEPMSEILFDNFSFPKILIDNVKCIVHGVPMHSSDKHGRHDGHVARQSFMKETRRTNLIDDEHVIIEIDKMFGKPFNFMHTKFNGMRTECWQISLIHIVAMLDNIQFGCIGIQPFRQMTVSNEMYFVYPRSIFFHASEPILQIIPISVSFGVNCKRLTFTL